MDAEQKSSTLSNAKFAIEINPGEISEDEENGLFYYLLTAKKNANDTCDIISYYEFNNELIKQYHYEKMLTTLEENESEKNKSNNSEPTTIPEISKKFEAAVVFSVWKCRTESNTIPLVLYSETQLAEAELVDFFKTQAFSEMEKIKLDLT